MSTRRRQNVEQTGEMAKGVAFGIVNGIMVTPVMISFASIIFRDHAFSPFMPSLIKLVLFSSLVHQLSFTLFSSLPFAVGQVQDAGLIFLSSMASSIVGAVNEENLIPTTLFLLSASTAGLGVMLMLIGKLRLASVVQFLPMPVVGGYLAFIGFFCGQAGLAMMSGVEIMTIADWPKLLNEKSLMLLLPGVFCGLGIYTVILKTRSPLSLPVCMVIILCFFYSILGLTGTSLQEARDIGWIAPLSDPLPFYKAWRYYDITAVEWSVFPSQVFRWVGMFLVVAFSSSLDIAAIEMELGLPMDYDTELMTVGLSNFFSGLSGGYTGSYIFSQTLFTMRSGINSRVCGYTIVICELVVLVLPFSVTSFIPKLLFGSLLVFIALDLMHEWLVMSRHKMRTLEYVVCVFTFVAIQYVGIEIGMLLGILGAMANFVFSYARKSNVTVTALRFSNAVRTFEERAILEANRGKIVTISLEGFVFFGSAVKLLEDVKRHVVINTQPDDGDAYDSPPQNSFRLEANASTELSPLLMSQNSGVKPNYTSPSRHDPPSPSKSSEHSGSFTHLLPVYGLTSDQIMAHHTKWKQLGNCKSDTMSSKSIKAKSFKDMLSKTGNLGDFSEQVLETHQDDFEVAKPLRKRNESDDYYLPLRSRDKSSNSIIQDGHKFVMDSVLLSIWGSQGAYRQERIRASSDSIGRNASESNLQLQIDEYDQSSPQHNVNVDDGGITHGLATQSPVMPTEYMILNFSQVSGVDATAARSCFLMLVQLLRGAGATIVFAIPDSDSVSLLKVHGVILEIDKVYDDFEDALEWCEEQVLYRQIAARSEVNKYQNEKTNFAFSPRPMKKRHLGRTKSSSTSMSNDSDDDKIEFQRLKESRNSFDTRYLASAWNDRQISPSHKIAAHGIYKDDMTSRRITNAFVDNRELLAPHESFESWNQDEVDFDPSPYRILRRILLDYLEVDPDERCPTSVKRVLHSHVLARFFSRKLYTAGSTVYHINSAAETLYFIEYGVVELNIPTANSADASTRVSKISTGGVFGDASFFLSSAYACSAKVTSEESVVWCLDKTYYALMEVENPQLCIVIQHVLLKSMSMAQASAVHTAYPSSTYSLYFK